MSKKKVSDRWSHRAGKWGRTITVEESEVGKHLQARWQVERRPHTMSLGFGIRNSSGGIDREAKKKAVDLATMYAGLWNDGISPSAHAESLKRQGGPTSAGRVTIGAGFALALDPTSGIWIGTQRHAAKERRAQLKLAEDVEHILGPGGSWEAVSATTAQEIWRHYLHLSSNAKQFRRKAAKVVQLIYQVRDWLVAKGHISCSLDRPERDWKDSLDKEWEQKHGPDKQPASHLRHTPEEAVRLFQSLADADPRLQVLIEVGSELREGQVIRSTRADLKRDGSGAFGLGRLIVHGRGRKRGDEIHLTPEMDAVFTMAMAQPTDDTPGGYLSELEEAWQAGSILDYPLFPGGRLRRGVFPLCRLRPDHAPTHSTTAIKWFRKYEKHCGVQHIPDRSFYGIRRQMTDIAPRFTGNSSILDRISGHAEIGTRMIYRDSERETERAAAARIKSQMRQALRAGTLPEGPADPRGGGLDETAIVEIAIQLARELANTTQPLEPALLAEMIRRLAASGTRNITVDV
jgi:hypothetical protein